MPFSTAKGEKVADREYEEGIEDHPEANDNPSALDMHSEAPLDEGPDSNEEYVE